VSGAHTHEHEPDESSLGGPTEVGLDGPLIFRISFLFGKLPAVLCESLLQTSSSKTI
jgi:hypothetical protein